MISNPEKKKLNIINKSRVFLFINISDRIYDINP